jgi:peroxiredoxin
MSFLEKAILDLKSNDKTNEILKKAYIKKNGKETGFDTYFGELQEKADKKLYDKYVNRLINKPAPDFTLTDLKGNQVSLSSLKGKLVVIDFWATWCGPCIASFPGMQKAKDKFGADQVAFYFVNSWESGANKENAEKFMGKKSYNFDVLIDDKDNVINAYKVSGIPTKFIIDKQGNIRFKAVGYSGSDEGVVQEITTMIKVLQNEIN